MDRDLTHLIETFPEFEAQARMSLRALSAVIDGKKGDWTLTVRGEAVAPAGQLEPPKVGYYTRVLATAHSEDGRMMGQDHRFFAHERFFGFEAFEIRLWGLLKKPAKIRVYPKR